MYVRFYLIVRLLSSTCFFSTADVPSRRQWHEFHRHRSPGAARREAQEVVQAGRRGVGPFPRLFRGSVLCILQVRLNSSGGGVVVVVVVVMVSFVVEVFGVVFDVVCSMVIGCGL